MSHKRTQLQLLDNVILEGGLLLGGDKAISVASSFLNTKVGMKKIVPHLIEIVATNQVFDVTDTGGVNGGFIAAQLATMPLTERFFILGAYFAAQVKAVGAGLANGTYAFGIGTDPANGGTLQTNESNWLTAALSLAVTSGVSAKAASNGPPIPLYIDSNPAEQLYLNAHIPDASISSNSTITLDIVFRGVFINLALGDLV